MTPIGQSTYARWLESCRQAGIPAISTDTAARIMAVLYEYGNNEGFTYNERFLAEMDYIKSRFGLHEMGVPEPKFHALLRGYIKELQDYLEIHKGESSDKEHPYRCIAPDWCSELLKERYNMKFIG